jgi:hypothetical protein
MINASSLFYFLIIFPFGKKYNQQKPIKNKINEAIKAGINISLLSSNALFKAAYSNQICKLTFKIRMNINVDKIRLSLFGFALFWLVLKLLIDISFNNV